MSARFWWFTMACAGGALAGGGGLGLYTITPQNTVPVRDGAPVQPLEGATSYYDSHSAEMAMKGPTVIRCTGCGPTLADRRMTADMAGWSGADDPIVQDYMAQADELSMDVAPSPLPAPVRTLPAVDGPSVAEDRTEAGRSPFAQWAQGGASTPATDATGAY